MRVPQNRWVWAGAGGLTLGAVGAELQRRHMRRIASDPEHAVLASPPHGRALRVRSPDGTMLNAEIFGAEDAATFVLAHGWTETLCYWAYIISGLCERGFRVVAFDLRGHGDSDPAVDGDYAMARFGEDLEAVLEAGVPEGHHAVVVGHSLGAMSVAAWAEHHDVGRRVGAAALLNTGFGDLVAESLLFPLPRIAHALHHAIAVRGFLGARAPLPRISTPASHAVIRYMAFGPAASPAQVAYYERMLVACPPDVRASVGIAMSEMELHHVLPRLTVPTLVMAGENDRLTPPSHARRIADMLPSLEKLIVLEDTGHMAPLERPAAVTAALGDLAVHATAGDHVAA
jgi:pimeloyl-ACP methyl ester carboxylesterase